MLSEKLYNKPASQLTEDEKATVSAFASLAAGIAGGLVGGDTSSAGNAAQAGKTTVENNYLSMPEAGLRDYLQRKADSGDITDEQKAKLDGLKQLDVDRDNALSAACSGSNSQACAKELQLAYDAKDSYQGYAEYQAYHDVLKAYPDQMAKYDDLVTSYSKDLIGLLDQGYSMSQASQMLDQKLAKDQAFQKSMDDMPQWVKISLVVQETVGLVYGAKAANDNVGAWIKDKPSEMKRPTPQQSEKDVGKGLGNGWREQVSFKDGKEVPYGTKGSTRPDWCQGNTCSVEVKNYTVSTNSSGLINNVSKQAIERKEHLPAGMTQRVVIDIRGQTVSAAQEDVIIKGIVSKSNGAIKPTDIQFKRK
nr:VENN motif pre-toxin domain-containing protein [Providencia rettgeri]